MPSAIGGTALDGAAACSGQTFSQPFLSWLDPADYALAPDGGFENGGAGWTLAGGASVVSGNEPFHVGSASDGSSLSLPAGGSATSPAMCTTVVHPDLRFFVRGSGNLFARVRVDVIFPDVFGQLQTLTVGTVSAGSKWQPTLQLPFLVSATAAVSSDGTLPVSFRFTAVGGNFLADDVYVDPYCGR